jgi:hypothetical protein
MKKLFENWNRYLNLSENEQEQPAMTDEEIKAEGWMTPEEVLATAKEKVGEGKEFDTIIDYVWDLWSQPPWPIPNDWHMHGPDNGYGESGIDYTALDQDYTREQNIIRQAHKEQRAEIGNIRDYFIDLHKDREAQSWRKNTGIHKAKFLDDVRRKSRGLPFNPGGGSVSYKKWIIIPDSEPLENPESSFHVSYDKAFKSNAKKRHIEIDPDEFRKQDLQKRIERLSGTGESQ